MGCDYNQETITGCLVHEDKIFKKIPYVRCGCGDVEHPEDWKACPKCGEKISRGEDSISPYWDDDYDEWKHPNLTITTIESDEYNEGIATHSDYYLVGISGSAGSKGGSETLRGNGDPNYGICVDFISLEDLQETITHVTDMLKLEGWFDPQTFGTYNLNWASC